MAMSMNSCSSPTFPFHFAGQQGIVQGAATAVRILSCFGGSAMLRRTLLAAAVLVAVPSAVSAQTLSVGARAGTLGLGGEVGVRLMNLVVLRGGAGILPVSFSGELGQSDLQFNVKPTSPLANVGLDLSLGDFGLRVGGGMLFLPNGTEIEGRYTGTVNFGGRQYDGSQIGDLTGLLDHGSTAPYVKIGFGSMTGRGMNIFMDLGAGFLTEPSLTLSASGPARNDPQFQNSLEQERVSIEENARKYMRILPIFSLGVRYGL
jgi:hypothetical protein